MILYCHFHVGSVLECLKMQFGTKTFYFVQWTLGFPSKQGIKFKANPQLVAGTYCGEYCMSCLQPKLDEMPGQQTDEVPPTGSHQLPENAFISPCTGGLTGTDSTPAVSLGGWWKGLWDDKGSRIIFDALVTARGVSWWDFKVISANDDWPSISPSWKIPETKHMAVG